MDNGLHMNEFVVPRHSVLRVKLMNDFRQDAESRTRMFTRGGRRGGARKSSLVTGDAT